MAKIINAADYNGKVFGDRIATGQFKRGYGGNTFLLCACRVGHMAWVKLAHLNAGTGGCCKLCHCRSIATKHGEAAARTRTYKAWLNMRMRVLRDPSYVNRGISVCKRWTKYELFKRDMGEPPDHRMQLDRINGNGSYSPRNCRWATRIQNNKNRTNLRMIKFGGMEMCIADWEKYLNLPTDCLRKKLRSNLPLASIMKACGFSCFTMPRGILPGSI